MKYHEQVKDMARFAQEVARRAYIQGASDASNGYVADNQEDIDVIVEQVGREILSKKREG